MSSQSTSQTESVKTYAFGGLNLNGELGTGKQYSGQDPDEVKLPNIKKFACSRYDSAFVTSDGKVYTSGLLKYGRANYERGVYPSIPSLVPVFKTIVLNPDDPKNTTVKQSKKITKIAIGSSFMVVATDDNEIYSWGDNVLSTLGTGDTDSRFESTFVKKFDVPIKKISCGDEHTTVLLSNGKVWTWGWNSHGDLGLGDTTPRSIPTKIPNLRDITDISCGGSHTCAVDQHGIVYAFGYNDYGQLGLGDTNHRLIPTRVPNLMNIKSVSCGYLHTVVLDIYGGLYSFGCNSSGQLGLNDKVDKLFPTKIDVIKHAEQVSCGSYTTAVITYGGKLMTFGLRFSSHWYDRDYGSIVQIQENVKKVVCGGHLIFTGK